MTPDDSIAAREPPPGTARCSPSSRRSEYRTPATRLVIWLRPARDNAHFSVEALFEAVNRADLIPLRHLAMKLEYARRRL